MWQGTWAVLFQVENSNLANILVRFGYLFIIFLPTFMYHFLALISRAKNEGKWILLSYVTNVSLAILLPTNIFVDGYFQYSWGYYPSAGLLHPIHVFQTIVVVNRGLFLLLKRIFSVENKDEHKRLLYVLVGLIIYFFAAIDYLCNYGFSFYPPGVIFVFVSEVLISYSILKYELMDIKLVITRSIANILAILPVLISFFLSLMFLKEDYSILMITILFLSAFWAFSFNSLQRNLQTYTEKKFLKGYYKTDEVINAISRKLINAQDRWSVLSIIAEEFKENIELKNIFVVYPVFDGKELKKYIFIDPQNSDDNGDNLDMSHPLISYFQNRSDIVRFADLPEALKKEDLKVNPNKESLFVPIRSMNMLQGVVVLGHKLNEDRYFENDIIFLDAVVNQVIVVFDRIAHQRKLIEANKRLNKMNKELEILNETLDRRVQEEVQISKHLMEEAQILSQQAALANLTKGIAHEIKNPINNMKINVLSIRDDINKNFLFKTDHNENDTWKGRLNKEYLETVSTNTDEADRLFQALLETGYVDEEGYLTSAFKPDRLDYDLELPEPFEHLEDSIDLYLKNLLLKKKYWKLTEILDTEFDRVSRITSSMLQYGETGKGITSSAFAEILPFADSTSLWEDLINQGYLNSSGFIEPKFKPEEDGFSLNLRDSFASHEKDIIRIIKDNPYARKKPIDVQQLIYQVLETCKGRFSKEDIDFSSDIDAVSTILGSEDALKQCLINIFDNSVDSLLKKDKDHRSLKVIAKNTSVDNKKGQVIDAVSIDIVDSGCGISPENIDKIRDPFFTTKTKTGGRNAGLGMPFIYQTVEGLDGFVDVQSELDKGTTIRLLFPSYLES